MEIARYWRLKEGGLAGPGGKLMAVGVDSQTLSLRDQLRGREVNLNHGGPVDQWAQGLVKALRGWGYDQEYIEQVAAGVAGSLNGKGEKFLEEVARVLADD